MLGEGASYSIDRAEFANPKGGENGTYTAMLDAGITVCSISCIQFVTGWGSTRLVRQYIDKASTSCQSNRSSGGLRRDPVITSGEKPI